MMNLFSVFDPVSYFSLSMKWMIILFIFFFMMVSYYKIMDWINVFLKMIKFNVNMIFSEVAKPSGYAITFFITSVFIYISVSNLIGLIPFVFTSTAFLNMTLGLSLVMWLSFFIMGWMKNFLYSCAHLVPEGSPLVLAPILVLIESISHLIRPMTLAVRLTANMMAGHLIIGLLSGISTYSLLSMMGSVMFQSLLLILELCVAVIQGFVFSILLLLYALEYY